MIEVEFLESFADKYKKGDKAKYSKDNARALVVELKVAKYVSEANKEDKKVKEKKSKY